MDDELHDLTPGTGNGLPDDDPAVRAFRSALGGGSRRAGDQRAVLAGIERRARTHQRRRLAGTTTLAVAALAVVVAVTPAVLGPRGGSDVAGPAGPTTSTPAPDESAQVTPQAAPSVTVDSLLRPEDVTFLGEGAALDGEVAVATGEVPAAGVCVDTADGVSPTSSSVQGTFRVPSDGFGDQEELLERVLRWDSQSEADGYLLAVTTQAATCSPTEVGLEGTGPWTAQDATAITPAGGRALAYTAPFGGFTDVQVVVASGNTVVRLQALVAEADPVLAVEQLTATATAAAERAFADATAPAGGPAPEGAPTDDSLAAS